MESCLFKLLGITPGRIKLENNIQGLGEGVVSEPLPSLSQPRCGARGKKQEKQLPDLKDFMIL